MKTRILIQGTVSELYFPNTGKVIPDIPQPLKPESYHAPGAEADSESGDFCYVSPGLNHGPFHLKDVLPGQTVIASLGTKGKSGRLGHMLELVCRAPYEIEPECPHAAECGGCRFQTVPYPMQLEWKETQVRRLLREIDGIGDALWLPILAGPLPLAYRNKMEFSFGDAYKGGPLTLGLHRRSAYHDIIETPSCRLVHPDLTRILAYTAEYFRKAGATRHSTYTHLGFLRHLVLRRSYANGEILVNLVTSTQADADIRPWVDGLLALPLEGRLAGILHTENDAPGDFVQSDRTLVLWGRDFLTEKLLGLSFRISPFSFFQTNTLGAEKLYECIRSLAGDLKGKTAFDLYCGTGTIAQVMASAGAEKVYGIEIVEEAAQAARENSELNGLTNCLFYAGDVLKLVDELDDRPDLIVLDPPREGINPRALEKILAFSPDTFLYVSCKPTSLARDLPAFTEAGYRVTCVRCCDMFPMTPGVETVVRLDKGPAENELPAPEENR